MSTVKIKMYNGAEQDFERDAMVCVVYQGEAGTEDAPRPHTSPFMVVHYEHGCLSLEAGASLVEAGLLADHIKAGDKQLVRKLENGEVKVYPDAGTVLDLPPSQLLGSPDRPGVLSMTRHAQTLETWSDLEAKRPKPRKMIRAALKERLRMFGEHVTPVVTGIQEMVASAKQAAETDPRVRRGKAA